MGVSTSSIAILRKVVLASMVKTTAHVYRESAELDIHRHYCFTLTNAAHAVFGLKASRLLGVLGAASVNPI